MTTEVSKVFIEDKRGSIELQSGKLKQFAEWGIMDEILDAQPVLLRDIDERDTSNIPDLGLRIVVTDQSKHGSSQLDVTIFYLWDVTSEVVDEKSIVLKGSIILDRDPFRSLLKNYSKAVKAHENYDDAPVEAEYEVQKSNDLNAARSDAHKAAALWIEEEFRKFGIIFTGSNAFRNAAMKRIVSVISQNPRHLTSIYIEQEYLKSSGPS